MKIPFSVRITALAAALTLGVLALFAYIAFLEDVALTDAAVQIAMATAARNIAFAFPSAELASAAPQDLARIRARLGAMAALNPGGHTFRIYALRDGAPVLLASSSTSGAPSGRASPDDDRFRRLFAECIATGRTCTTSVYHERSEDKAVALAPITGADGRVAGLLAIERSAASYRELLAAARAHIIWLACAAIAASVIVGVLTSVRVMRPLGRLYEAVLAARDGRFTPVPIAGTRELAELARNFNNTNAALQSKIDELAELNSRLDAIVASRTQELIAACENMGHAYDAVGRDLAAARRVQETIMPRGIRRDRFSVAVEYVPIMEVGGDLGIILERGPSVFEVAIGDVTGHGVGAALVCNRVHAILSAFGGAHATPERLYRRLDHLLSQEIAGLGMFLTLFWCRFDLDRMVMEYAGAGHGPALHYRRSTGSMTVLDSRCGIIGLGELLCEGPVPQALSLEPGDCVCICTDGLVEAADHARTPFGMERLKAALSDAVAFPDSAEDVASSIIRTVSAFAGGSFQDDVSVMVVKIL